MIDALRKDAWPRGVRRQRRELEAAREQLRRELGCEPSLADLAAKMGSDEKRLGRTIVRINAIESTSPLASGRKSRRVDAAGGAHSVRAGTARHRLREVRNKDRIRAAIESLPPREQKVIGLYYYKEATMKQIGAEIGVNESRVSQLHARAIRRLRDALAGVMPAAEAAKAMRTAILEFQQKPRMAKATLDSAQSAVVAAASECIGDSGLRERFADGAQQVGEPERFGEPAAAAFLEEALGVGACDITGDEDDPSRERRRGGGNRAVKRHPVDARHLQIADHQRHRSLFRTQARASSPSPA